MSVGRRADASPALPGNTVSIIIPTYNRSWGLRQAVESVLTQSYPWLELIVVDDASEDDTEELMVGLADRRIHYHRQAENVGMVANWGTGLRLATGKFVAFLMDDDLIGPGFVARRVESLLAAPECAAVFSEYTAFAADEPPPSGAPLPGQGAPLDDNDLLRAVLARDWFIGTALYRREPLLAAWEKVTGDDLVLDFALNLELALSGKRVLRLAGSDFWMRQHAGQNSQRFAAQVYAQTAVVLERALRSAPSGCARSALRKELASWHVLFGRRLAERDQIGPARERFLLALRTDPTLAWAWRQLACSIVAPGRLIKPVEA